MTSRRQRTARAALFLVIQGALVASPHAHNKQVHQDIVDAAYESMLAVEASPGSFSAPPGVPAGEWAQFIAEVAAAPARLRAHPSGLPDPKTLVCLQVVGATNTMNAGWSQGPMGNVSLPVSTDYIVGSDCGVRYDWAPDPGVGGANPPSGSTSMDHTGLVLGFWAASVDDEFDETHLWIRPTNALGLGFLKDFLDDLIDAGFLVILLPFVCLFDCIFGDCDECDDDAADIADGANVIDDLEGLLPGIGDISGEDYVGMWHHINVGGSATNEYDNHQGWLLDESGPPGPPDPLDLVLMAVFDASGLSVNAEESLGVERYQIESSDDSHPDTDMRSTSEWQFTSAAHVPFEPLDNLAYYGWRKFRDEADHPVKHLGWPLHAIGDAIVPMHVAATSSWGHRPFEDATEQEWDRIPLRASVFVAKAFRWWKFTRDWRALHPGHENDVPVRELVTAVASETYDYALSSGWPFHPTASTEYLASKEFAISTYTSGEDIELMRPLIDEGVGATLALLVGSSEVLP